MSEVEPHYIRGSSAETAYRDPAPWKRQAACRWFDSSVFWPENGDMRPAQALCGACPVLEECLRDAWATGDYGPDTVFRAGLTGLQRKERKKRSVHVRHCDRCGAGFIGGEAARYCGPICRREAATAQMRRRRA